MICLLYGSLAQLVEQRPEEPCVTSSSLVGATTKKSHEYVGFFRGAGKEALSSRALGALRELALDYFCL